MANKALGAPGDGLPYVKKSGNGSKRKGLEAGITMPAQAPNYSRRDQSRCRVARIDMNDAIPLRIAGDESYADRYDE
jgi:hypothetical protein